jgi:hypothetical protein
MLPISKEGPLSWVGALILLVGITRAVRAIVRLRVALRSRDLSTLDWSCATAIWIAWCAIGIYLTMAGIRAVWPAIAFAALLGIDLALGVRWRARHSTSRFR